LVSGRAGSPLLQAINLARPDAIRTVTLPAPLLAVSDLKHGRSPQGGWLAVRTRSEAGSPEALVLVSLADGRVEPISPLLSADLQNRLQEELSGNAPGPAVQALRAVEDTRALAWSPDGTLLAFAAAVDGPSSDLYVFHLERRRYGRLTTGLNQTATPFWSPDSRWIVHQEVKELGVDGRWEPTAVWAAGAAVGWSGVTESGKVLRADIRRLYTPPAQGEGEEFLGWTEDGTLIVYSRAGTGGRFLREVPLSARWSAPIYSPRFAAAAVDSTGREFAVLHDTATGAPAGLSPGLYRLHAYSGTPQLVLAGEWNRAAWWDPPGLFVAFGPAGAASLTVQGEAHLYSAEANLSPSPDGKWMAGWGDLPATGLPEAPGAPTGQTVQDTPVPAAATPSPGATPTQVSGTAAPDLDLKPGVRLYRPDGPALQELSTRPAVQLLWAGDSRRLFFLAEGVLYQAAFPQAIPEMVGEAEGMSLVP
jgi:hypothetical protein